MENKNSPETLIEGVPKAELHMHRIHFVRQMPPKSFPHQP